MKLLSAAISMGFECNRRRLEAIRKARLVVKWQRSRDEVIALGPAFSNPILPIGDVVKIGMHCPLSGFVEERAIQGVLRGNLNVAEV